MVKRKQRAGLLELVKDVPRKQDISRMSWFDVLPQDQQEELRELRAASIAGEVLHSRNDLLAIVCKYFSIQVSRSTFNDWWRREANRHGKTQDAG